MIVDLKVHVEIFHYKGRQGSNMRPRESFFQSSRKYFFEGERFSKKNLNKRPPRKINMTWGSRKHLFIREEWLLQINKLDQPP